MGFPETVIPSGVCTTPRDWFANVEQCTELLGATMPLAFGKSAVVTVGLAIGHECFDHASKAASTARPWYRVPHGANDSTGGLT
jgi:hypothetical protein